MTAYSQQDYLDGFLNLLPVGRMWNREPGSPMYQAISALIPTISRFSDSATNLLADGFIGTTNFLLPEWQATLGLPDPCLPATATFEQQRAQAIARFVGIEGESIAFLTAYAANLGYAISINEYSNFHVGASKVGVTKIGDLANSWLVTAPAEIANYFKVGINKVCEKLASLDSEVLECEINAISPAHTIVYYNITPTIFYGSYLDIDFYLDHSLLG